MTGEFLQLVLLALFPAFILSLLLLKAGSGLVGKGLVGRLGAIAHERKMKAVETSWPLTKLRPAIASGDRSTVITILSSLIALKSFAAFPLGMFMIVWLPLACILVPALVAEHDPDDAGLARWVGRVATLQVTSHLFAAAAGFAIFVRGYWQGEGVIAVMCENWIAIVALLLLSLLFAVAAGRKEASGVMERGL